MHPRLKSVKMQGYRHFRAFSAQLGSLEVIVGASGSGKLCLFEFLSLLRDSVHREIPPEIVPTGSIGQRAFHSPGPERIPIPPVFLRPSLPYAHIISGATLW
jgi:predicted ATPase